MSKAQDLIRVYRYQLSGHCHRVELLLSLLGVPFERVEVNLLRGEHRSADFLAKNSFAQVPVLEDGEVTLADSNAILIYIAMRYDHAARWLPRDPVGAAGVQRWLSVAAGELASGPNAARLVHVFGARLDHDRAKAVSERLLAVLEAYLQKRRFLVGAEPTIADVAMYAYTARAPEGAVSLDPFPNVRRWLERMEALPGFVPMVQAPAPVM